MVAMNKTDSLISHPDRLYIGGEWVEPSSSDRIQVIESATEEIFLTVAEARREDMNRAITAAREAFDNGPWPSMAHRERAEYLLALGTELRKRADLIGEVWPREAGALKALAEPFTISAAETFEYYGGLAEVYPFEEPVTPARGGFGLRVREPVGVVGAIIPWNGPIVMIANKVAPALLAGCTVVLKCSPEAPAEGYIVSELAELIGLPPGVFNMVTADRQVSEVLVRDPRVDKITFTGSTAAGRRIASICGERIARCTLELGGKSAAIILDDADIGATAATLAQAECRITGQVCSSLTRIILPRHLHDEMVDALASAFTTVRMGNPLDADSQMGPLVSDRQRDRVMGYIAKGREQGASLIAGGGRPASLPKGYFVEPTVFANVHNSMTIAQEEIFGPVLSVIPTDDENSSIRIANETIYGLNASVFTKDTQRAVNVARRLRSGTVGQNGSRTDITIGFGGVKQSGIGREGGTEGLSPFLETKAIILDQAPYPDSDSA